MTYKTLRRKSDGQWMRYNYTCIYEVPYPVPTPISFSSKIDWSLYELIEVAAIPVYEFPDELDIDSKIQDIGKGLGIEGVAGARLMIEWYKSQILKP